MMEELIMRLVDVLCMADWQDVVSFLVTILYMKLVIVYLEDQGVFHSFSSSSDLQREPLFSYVKLNCIELPLMVFFLLRFITAIVKKKEGEEGDCHPTCCIAHCL